MFRTPFVLTERCQDPGKPQNGWPINNKFDHGGVVKFMCRNKSYDLIGASEIMCNDGDWSHPTPSCEGKSVDILY